MSFKFTKASKNYAKSKIFA